MPFASMLAETVTLPCTFACFADVGYVSRDEEINLASRTILGAAIGAGAAGTEDGGAGGLEVRPEDVSNPAGVDPATGSITAISAIGEDPPPKSASF